MQLTTKQQGVARGAATAAILTVTGLAGVALLLPETLLPTDEPVARMVWAMQWALLPIITLVVAVGRMGNQRFYTPQDIDGAGLTQPTEEARIRQAILQNTLEQVVIALPVYLVWALVMPLGWLPSICVAATLFVCGRVLFTHRYVKGAAGRAMGFGLTFYPSMGMLVALVCMIVGRIIIDFSSSLL